MKWVIRIIAVLVAVSTIFLGMCIGSVSPYQGGKGWWEGLTLFVAGVVLLLATLLSHHRVRASIQKVGKYLRSIIRKDRT